MSASTLSCLSPDIFDTLAQYLEAKDVVLLLTTGNRFIISLVEKRGSLSYVTATFTRTPLKWPVFFARQRRLRALFAQDAATLTTSISFASLDSATLQTLPNTLSSIHLGFASAESAWLNSDGRFAFEISAVFPNLNYISLSGAPAWTDAVIKDLPINLVSLRLFHNNKLTAASLIDLPRHLEEFAVPACVQIWTDDLEQFLPPNLTKLSLLAPASATTEQVSKLRKLQFLTSLELNFEKAAPPNYWPRRPAPPGTPLYELINELPSTLKSLTLHHSTQVPNAAAIVLPPSLTCLRMRDAIEIPFQNLPSSLTTLEVSSIRASLLAYGYHILPEAKIEPRNVPGGYGAPVARVDGIRNLPPNITHLNYVWNNLIGSDFITFPPHLTFLQCVLHQTVNKLQFLEFLPKKLQTLSVPNLCLTHRDLLLLPPNINEIFIKQILLDDDFIFDLFNPDTETFKLQKRKISTLDKSQIIFAALQILPIPYHTWKPLPWVFAITSNVLIRCPKPIQAIDLECIRPGSDQQPELSGLPDHLTFINLPKASSFWPWGDVDITWPSGLVSLRLDTDYSLPAAQIEYLPRHMTVLRLTWNESVTDEEVLLLPPDLTDLDLSYNNYITDDGIAHLPKGLTRLSLWNNAQLTSACIPLLPRGLKELLLAKAKTAPESFVDLPPSIEVLDLGSGRYFPFEDVTILPVSLRTITWYWLTPLYLACKQHLPNLYVPENQVKRMPTKFGESRIEGCLWSKSEE